MSPSHPFARTHGCVARVGAGNTVSTTVHRVRLYTLVPCPRTASALQGRGTPHRPTSYCSTRLSSAFAIPFDAWARTCLVWVGGVVACADVRWCSSRAIVLCGWYMCRNVCVRARACRFSRTTRPWTYGRAGACSLSCLRDGLCSPEPQRWSVDVMLVFWGRQIDFLIFDWSDDCLFSYFAVSVGSLTHLCISGLGSYSLDDFG